MTEVTLEAYTDEINQMVEEASYLEALAHLRHILDHYPRYLKAYYVLGEMMLEADLPQLAADMFLRVLNADPEHLLARIGLALAHDKLDNTQAATWNLQQALELDPGNKELETEIRRLYERDGNIAPDYMPLTRPGLARLYLRGTLYSRAEEELQQLLKENPQRIDLQLALAEAYWRDDQIVQAADTCQQTLNTLPYCLKANLLLGNLWLNSGQESGKRYLERAQEIDPDNHLAAELFGDASPLKEQKTAIERLVYEPDALSVDQESEWFKHLEAASVSIGISEALPEMSESEMKLVDIAAGLESQIQIPDWLRGLGPLTEEETGEMPAWLEEETAPAEAVGAEAPAEAAGIAAAPTVTEEMPAWLQELQTPEAESAETPVEAAGVAAAPAATERAEEEQAEAVGAEAPAEAEEIPDWLQELQTPEAESAETPVEAAGVAAAPAATERAEEEQAEAVGAEAPAEAEEIPDWLQELQHPTAAEEAAVSESPATAEKMPEWLQELQPSEAVETGEEGVVPTEAEEMFGWTSFPGAAPIAEAEGFEVERAEAPVETAGAETPVAAEEIPEWLQELHPPEAAPVAEAVGVEAPAEEEGLLSGDDALARLAGLAEGKEEELRAQAKVEQEARVAEIMGRQPVAPVEAPAEAERAEAPAEALAEAPAEEAEEIPELLQELPSPEAKPVAEAVGVEAPAEEEGLLSGDDALAWLAGLAEGKEEELRAQAEVEQEARVAEIMGRRPIAPVEAPAEAEELPEWLQELQPPEAAPVAEAEAERAEAPAEAERAEAPAEALAEAPAEEAEEIPEWLQELQPPEAKPVAEAVGVEAPAEEEGLLSGDDALAWLAGLAEGKEEELRAQAKVEQETRVAEIMGRQPVAPVEAPAEAERAEAPAEEAEEIPEWLQELQPPEAKPVAEAVGVEAPAEEEGLLSGDDALAWLAGLAEGKEEELRAQAKVEQEARVAEIMGRQPVAPVEAPAEAERAEAPAEAAEITPPTEAEEIPEWLQELPSPEAAPVAEAEAERVEAPAEAAEITPPTEAEEIPEWLQELRPPASAEEAPAEATPEEEKPFFGWSGFDVEAAVAEAEQAPEAVEPEPLTSFGFTRFKEEEEIAAPEAPVEAEEIPEWLQELQTPEVTRAEAESTEAERAKTPVEAPAEAERAKTPVEAPVEEIAAAVEPEITEEAARAIPTADLDEGRAYVATHDSDYNARLALAQSLWQAGQVEEATKHYGHLIHAEQFLTEIASDLQERVAATPQDPRPLSALGDVYLRQGALEQALDCYRQALHLL